MTVDCNRSQANEFRNDLYSAAATSVIIALATFVLSFGFLKLIGRRAFDQED